MLHRYKISNRAGVHVYQAVEDTGFCWRCCCTQLRPVHMKVYDQTGSQVRGMSKRHIIGEEYWKYFISEE